ncbi:hypothetical protein IQ249_15130 [Lusitaniella coriacea LEGE 07157]|uniref:Uncharacterized protein n=1 Tax=Lusitaniella coriacea LEGE 07157 TaxID=945747 RepID=A0A8J7DXI9_9CYAN|nr:hypothetical protein [Lusitaniella coriacea]MBE9117232.1 hypothetical protein [Lusitaniella coriacea LEGE 07157]
MNFCIQVSNPVFLYSPNEIASDLAEAIQVIFPMETEKVFIVWNCIYIPLSYKYDISVIIDDILPMLSDVTNKKKGSYRVFFGSDTFNAEWNLSWYDESIYISAKWNNLAGNLVDLALSNCSKLETKIEIFLSEYKKLLQQLSIAVEKSELSIVEQESYKLMLDLQASIKNYGSLYQVDTKTS